jgi:hypothetical protein
MLKLKAFFIALFCGSSIIFGQGGWTDDGTTVRLTTSTDKVGIGTTTVGTKLQVNGNAAIGYGSSVAGPANGLLVNSQILIGQNQVPPTLRQIVAGTGTGQSTIELFGGKTSWTSIYFADTLQGSGEYEGALQYNHSDNHMDFYTNHAERMRITSTGQVAIGKTTASFTVDVSGGLRADSIIASKVRINNWTLEAPDYVFNKNYNLPKLQHVEKFIKINSHLPEIPSAKQMKKNGVDLVEMNMLLLKKLEETTLYLIEQDKRIKDLESKISMRN